MTIYAIIWDLGGVLVRTEDRAPRDNVADRLGMTRGELSGLVFGGRVNSKAQLGEVSYEKHWEYVGQKLGIPAGELEAVQKDFFGGDVLDVELVDYIRKLKKNYCTVLLSNAFSNLRTALEERWQIDDAFHHIVISAEVGLMKPDPAIYRLALEKTGFEPEEAVFIDDFAQNVEGARDVGLRAIHFQDRGQARAELETLLDKVEA